MRFHWHLQKLPASPVIPFTADVMLLIEFIIADQYVLKMAFMKTEEFINFYKWNKIRRWDLMGKIIWIY